MGRAEENLAETLIDPEQLDNPDGTWTKGEPQEAKCRDAWAALLFGAQFVAIFAVAIALGVPAMEELTDADEVNGVSLGDAPDYYGLIYGCCVAGAFALAFSGLSLFIMSCCPKLLIQISLLFSLVLSALMVAYCFYLGETIAAIFSLIFFALSLCYAYCVWRRIPFAAANLNTGLTAVKTNAGVVSTAYVSVIISYAYSVLWMVALAGVYDKEGLCETDASDGNGGGVNGGGGGGTNPEGTTTVQCEANLAWGYYFLMLLALFWTQQVLKNTIHVTIAGVVSTWWFTPAEANSCCSGAIKDSFVRATTTSFGSICFGSLLVAIIQTLRAMIQQARSGDQDGGMAFFLCILECLVRCVEDMLEYFNKFAYIYVGMYGYSYLEAGKNVMTLFGQKGWTVIISDDLINNVLFLFALVAGLLTGGIGLLMHEIQPSWFDVAGADDENVAMGTAFGLCFLVGIVISCTTLGVVDSSVDTVLVCFAEAPREFEENHPELSQEMRGAWREVYPAECGF